MALLVPIDLSAPSRYALGLAARVGRVLGEDAVLLHVSSGPTPLGDLALLHALARPLHQVGMRARLRELVGSPAEQICLEARARRSPWVILGTRGIPSDQPGSVARELLSRCRVPVIAIRPGHTPEESWLLQPTLRPPRAPEVRWLAQDAPPSLAAAAHLLAEAVEGKLKPLILGSESPDLVVLPFHHGSGGSLDALLAMLDCPVALVGGAMF